MNSRSEREGRKIMKNCSESEDKYKLYINSSFLIQLNINLGKDLISSSAPNAAAIRAAASATREVLLL